MLKTNFYFIQTINMMKVSKITIDGYKNIDNNCTHCYECTKFCPTSALKFTIEDGNSFKGKALVLDTPYGQIVKNFIDNDVNIGVSSRALGTLAMTKEGYNLVQDDLRIATAADVVADPSAPGAFVQGIMEGKDFWYDISKGSWIENDVEKLYGDVKKYSIKNQQMLAKEILNKINEIYDFEFSTIVDYNTEDDINEIYNFLTFLEFDNEKFLLSIWKYLDIGLSNCIENGDKIIYEIEENLKSKYYSKLIIEFLRTNNKSNLVEWFCRNSQKIRSLILIEKGTKNERHSN
jgi:ferredoxin